ncbi:nucleotide exchange factor GrpE [Glycomyces tarimensis]
MSDEDKRKADETGDAEEASPDAGGEDAGDTDEELTVDDILAEAPDDGQATEDTVSVLQSTLEERTRDLQRLNAEFQNYRKRVERDKSRAGEQATAAVLSSLLPILDDLDRAREHGDLNGPFGSVAEQLTGALAKQGLESFGEKGDAFDPTIHEAVAHMQMGDVDGPTCIDVMRHGYRLGERLLRPALVAVAEPLDEDPAEQEASVEEADGRKEPVDGDDGEDTLVEPEPEGAVEPAEAEGSGESGGPRAEASGDDTEGGAADGDGPSAEDTKGERDS